MRVEAQAIEGLSDFLDVAETSTRQAASLAMNDVIGGTGLTAYRKKMQSEIAFPPGYLDDDRFGQRQKARPENLTASISARARATSLARFSSGGSFGQGGVTVTVGAGNSKSLKGAFLTRLNRGASITEDDFNVGLAVRVKPGDTLRNKHDAAHAARLAPNVFLLYGPSVDQVFRSVSETETPEVLDMIEAEFYRQFGRLAGGR